jgi:hypothetical protein
MAQRALSKSSARSQPRHSRCQRAEGGMAVVYLAEDLKHHRQVEPLYGQ